jgi:hypothetical protein
MLKGRRPGKSAGSLLRLWIFLQSFKKTQKSPQLNGCLLLLGNICAKRNKLPGGPMNQVSSWSGTGGNVPMYGYFTNMTTRKSVVIIFANFLLNLPIIIGIIETVTFIYNGGA